VSRPPTPPTSTAITAEVTRLRAELARARVAEAAGIPARLLIGCDPDPESLADRVQALISWKTTGRPPARSACGRPGGSRMTVLGSTPDPVPETLYRQIISTGERIPDDEKYVGPTRPHDPATSTRGPRFLSTAAPRATSQGSPRR
jgi:hypothetical protein